MMGSSLLPLPSLHPRPRVPGGLHCVPGLCSHLHKQLLQGHVIRTPAMEDGPRGGIWAGTPDTDSEPSQWGIPGSHIPGIWPRKRGPGGHEPIVPEIPHPVRRAGDYPNSAGDPRSEPFSPRSKAGTTQPMAVWQSGRPPTKPVMRKHIGA